jgi:hypothetical protein
MNQLIHFTIPGLLLAFGSTGNASAVPEPSFILLMSIGGALIGLGLLGRRKVARK